MEESVFEENMFKENMREVSQPKDGQHHRQNQNHVINELQQRKESKNQLEQQVNDVLNEIYVKISEMDPRVCRGRSLQGTMDLVLSYAEGTNTSQPAFEVSVTSHSNAVVVKISDGYWRGKSGIVGDEPNSPNEQSVYTGPLDAVKIRRAVETAFLKWYAWSMKNAGEHPVEPS